MAFIAEDRVRDTSTSTGSPFTVSGVPPDKHKTFDDVMAVNDTCQLLIVHRTANEWEVGYYTKSAADQLTRDSVESSSNADAAVTFSAGTKDVIMVYPQVGSTAEYLANTVGRMLSTEQVNAAGALLAINDSGGAIAWDMSLGFNASITLDGNHTFSNPTNTIVGRTGAIVVTQDGTGTRVPAWGTSWEAAGGTFPTLSTTPGAKDVIFYWIQSSTSIIITGILKALA